MRSLHKTLQRLLYPGKPQPEPSTGDRSRSTRSLVNWVLPNKLALGRLPRSGDEIALSNAGIGIIISLCAPSEGQLPSSFTETFHCIRYILPDSSFIMSLRVEQLAHAVHVLHQQIQTGQAVYLHCLAGIQRSPTVCIAYLCRYHQLELWEAIQYVRQVRSKVSLTEAHIQVIQAFLTAEAS